MRGDPELQGGGPRHGCFPVFEGMAMGWVWVLHFCHCTLCKVGEQIGGAMVRDRTSLVTPTIDRPLRCPYVDNGNVIGLNKESVQATLDEVISDLTGAGFKVHEQVDATEQLSLVGVVFDGHRRSLRLTHRRCWRLHAGLLHFCSWMKAAGWMVRVMLGHVVNAFQLLRWGLSILSSS